MRSFRTIARGAPALALALAATLSVSALRPPAPVGAAAEPAEPAARLQVVIKQVYIHDDREGFLSGEGEMGFYVGVRRCNEGIPPPCLGSFGQGLSSGLPSTTGFGAPIVRAGALVNAGTGDTVTLDREVPAAGDGMYVGDTSPELGFPVYAGQHYVLQFEMEEWDNGCELLPGDCDEYMGYVLHILDTGEHGLGLGTHTARSVGDDPPRTGDFTVTYEIRRAPLPDLEPVNIQVQDLPGSAEKRVCMAVVNREIGHPGPFVVALSVDGVVPPDGRYTVFLLDPGTHHLACVYTELTSGQHELAAVVDKARAVPEFNEANNVYRQTYTATQSSSSSSPSQALPDLTVSAIRVRGQVPDGKDDCKDGRNDIAIVVKNAGTAKAGGFRVRLVVDADSGAAKEEEVADGLDAGQEHEVRFDDVRLKKGERTLTAIADPTTGIGESKEDNNELKVTARCKDDD